MLISKEVEVKVTGRMITYWEGKGYVLERRINKYGALAVPLDAKLTVKVEDLKDSSDAYIEVKCDYCGKHFQKQYKHYLSQRKTLQKDACYDCCYLKNKEILQNKYGDEVISPSLIHGVGNKISEGKIKYNIDDIRKEFYDRGFVLLSTEYINTEEYLYYICSHHEERGVQKITYANFLRNRGCKLCGNIKIGNKLRSSFDKIEKLFIKNNYTLLSKEYENNHEYLYYKCNKHSHIIQKTTYGTLAQDKQKCKYCTLERLRNTKIDKPRYTSDLFEYLRTFLYDWKQDSIKRSNYKCALTGLRFQDIHHIYSFNTVVYDTLKELNLPLYDKYTDYGLDDIRNIEYCCKINHYKHPFGVCLNRDIHIIFHAIYGYGNNTEQQFDEFKQNYYNGEYDDFLSEELKSFNSIERLKKQVS